MSLSNYALNERINYLQFEIDNLTPPAGGYVPINGNTTINNIKTFSTLPQSSVVPVSGNDLVNKTYADGLVGVSTLQGVLSNGNTATGSMANINLVDTDVGGALNPILNLQNTNASGSVSMEVYKNKPTAGIAGDVLFNQSVYGKDAGNLKQEYTRISHTLRDASTGGEDGSIEFSAFVNGAVNTFLQINGNENEINCLKTLDMGGNTIRTTTGNMTIQTTSSSGTGTLSIQGKGTTTMSAPTVGITATGASSALNLHSVGANAFVSILGADDVALTAGTGDILLTTGGSIKTDKNITTLTGINGSIIDFAGGTPDEKFDIAEDAINLHWNNLTDQADITLENDIVSANSVINMFYQSPAGNMNTIIQNIPSVQRIQQIDSVNSRSAEYSPTKIDLVADGGATTTSIKNRDTSSENRIDFFKNQGGGIYCNSGIVNNNGGQTLYLSNTDNAFSKSINISTDPTGLSSITHSNSRDGNPFAINTDTDLVVESTKAGGSALFKSANGVEIEGINSVVLNATSGAGGSITLGCNTTGSLNINGTALQSNTAGGNSGEHLVIVLNGNTYKIKLENP